MLILDDHSLAEVGLDYPTALALLQPSAEELVVHIRRELGPAEAQPQAVDSGISLRVDPPDDAGGANLRLTHEEETQAELFVPTEKPPIGPHDEGAVIGRRTAHPAAEDRGYNFAELERVAKEQRLSLVYTGSVYTLQGVFGQKFYGTLAEVVGALRYGRF